MPPAIDPKRRALGKGLESLLPSRPAPTTVPAITAVAESTGKPLEIPLDHIERNPFQTRTRFDEAQLTELRQSIAASGVVQPIVVRPLNPHNGQAKYQLITGERRWLASRKAGKATIPAIVRQVADEQALEMTIVENLQRADLNPMEQARAYQRLSHDFKMTQEQMAARTGKERASVANFLRLLRLPEPIQHKVESGDLSFGHARTLLALDSPESITAAAQKVMALSLSVRQTESYVQGLINPEAKPKKSPNPPNPKTPTSAKPRTVSSAPSASRSTLKTRTARAASSSNTAGLEDFDSILTALGGQ